MHLFMRVVAQRSQSTKQPFHEIIDGLVFPFTKFMAVEKCIRLQKLQLQPMQC